MPMHRRLALPRATEMVRREIGSSSTARIKIDWRNVLRHVGQIAEEHVQAIHGMSDGAQTEAVIWLGFLCKSLISASNRSGKMGDAAETGDARQAGQGRNGTLQFLQQLQLLGRALALDQRADALAQFRLNLRHALEEILADFDAKIRPGGGRFRPARLPARRLGWAVALQRLASERPGRSLRWQSWGLWSA
jgi:hypothetical protein